MGCRSNKVQKSFELNQKIRVKRNNGISERGAVVLVYGMFGFVSIR
jgi:hypothetical protein